MMSEVDNTGNQHKPGGAMKKVKKLQMEMHVNLYEWEKVRIA